MKAIALLEVQAMVAAIAGLDAMVKAANVNLIHVEKRLGGRVVTVVVEGEVSAVTAAAEAGAKAAAEVGNVKLCEVIARPHPDVMKFLTTVTIDATESVMLDNIPVYIFDISMACLFSTITSSSNSVSSGYCFILLLRSNFSNTTSLDLSDVEK